MGKRMKQKRKNTMFSLLVRPILSILLVLIGIYTLLIQQGVLSYLKVNAVTVFEERVSGRRLSVSNDMINRWSNIRESAESITEHLEQIVEEQNAELSDIHVNATLNQQILDELMEETIGTLRACGSTEIFLILDGDAVRMSGKENEKAGIYLRNGNPEFFSSDNQDLLLERGVPAISKKWQISLDSYWAAGFEFSDETNPNHLFFQKPLNAAKESDNWEICNFGYWGYGAPIDEMDRRVLSYSLPLIASDGTVVGVMGTGVSQDFFGKLLNFRELADGKNGAYFLARTTDGEHFEPVIFSGSAYNKKSFLGHELTIAEAEDGSVKRLIMEDGKDNHLCASVQYLQLYDPNTPFEEEQWALVGVIPERTLFSAYERAKYMLLLLAVVGIGLGIAGALATSRQVTKPLRRLLEELRGSDTNKPIQLERLKVEEIDELVNAIESLSTRVAASASKISTIIQMAESGIGVFEYRKGDHTVFCSHSMFEIFHWNPVADTNEYVDSQLFAQRMAKLKEQKVPDEENLYEVELDEQNRLWIRMNWVEDEESVIGVVTDVTSTVLEKQQIEYERDYDVLTSLYNLRAFNEYVRRLEDGGPEKLKTGALVMWDLDNLKFVNDVYGHHVGDSYIIALADCLRKYQGPQILSARRSGDEFFTVFWGYENTEQIMTILDELWREVAESEIPLPDGSRYRVRVSAGVSWYPEQTSDFSKLFSYSDFAMYTVKHNSKGNIVSFDPAAYHENWYLAQGQGDFNTLVDNRLVRYAAQPILAVADGSIYGYEMLMRSELDSFRSPADILRMAHAQSRLYDIEVMTWFEALKAFRSLREREKIGKDSRVFINSISSQVIQESAVQQLEEDFRDCLSFVVCEFTEEEQSNEYSTTTKLETMKRWNAKVAIDDYGCGYNSESALLTLQPDIVKIDIGIIRGIDCDQNRQRLVKNLVLYAHERNILVLGEGIERREELKTLIALGIDLAQGYYVAKPSFDAAPPDEQVCKEAADWYREKEESKE